ncbi:MAG TPA: thermonuclease family protein, partial [Bryobacteraceae bacterium]|nr:thermonuclease family protein [Bryobacteraceae bacterium]
AAPPQPRQEADYQAKVTAVTDGDTIEVLRQRTRLKIRLFGVDAPEKRQPFAERARQRVADLALGRTVTVIPRGNDRFGRCLAWIVLPGNSNLNETLVAEGLAWWFRRYAPHQHRLEELERAARDHGAGLWAEPDPTPPWLWRRARRK